MVCCVAKSLEGGSGVKTVKEAKKVIRHEAERLVEPVIKLYMAAEAYGQTITEKEFETYKDEYLRQNSYNDYITYYTPVIEKQLLSGGLRLAKLLNELYE